MQKYGFGFIKQIFSGFISLFKAKKPALPQTITLETAIRTGQKVEVTFVKESTNEITTRKAEKLHYNKSGNVLFQDLEKDALRSFKPENLQTLIPIYI